MNGVCEVILGVHEVKIGDHEVIFDKHEVMNGVYEPKIADHKRDLHAQPLIFLRNSTISPKATKSRTGNQGGNHVNYRQAEIDTGKEQLPGSD